MLCAMLIFMYTWKTDLMLCFDFDCVQYLRFTLAKAEIDNKETAHIARGYITLLQETLGNYDFVVCQAICLL